MAGSEDIKKLNIYDLTNLLEQELTKFVDLTKSSRDYYAIDLSKNFIEELLTEIESRESPLLDLDRNLRAYYGGDQRF